MLSIVITICLTVTMRKQFVGPLRCRVTCISEMQIFVQTAPNERAACSYMYKSKSPKNIHFVCFIGHQDFRRVFWQLSELGWIQGAAFLPANYSGRWH